MIRIYTDEEIPQGSEEWHAIRNGKVTGTDAYNLLRKKNVNEIITNKLNAKPFHGNYYTKRGHILEDEARQIYSEVYQKVDKVGFVTNSKYKLAGISPDGLISTDGYWECKAFQEARHLSVYKNLDAAIIAQVQFGLFITERKWCDLTLYSPDIEDISKQFLIRRIYPDPQIHQTFARILKS